MLLEQVKGGISLGKVRKPEGFWGLVAGNSGCRWEKSPGFLR